MRKYLIISAIASVFMFTSCDDQLDRTPVDSLVEVTAFQTVSDLQFGLNGVLGNLNPDNVVAFNAIYTDNCRIGIDNGGQQLGILRQNLNPDGGDGGLWADRYNAINGINRVLAAAESITPQQGEGAQYNDIIGMSKALRAFFHLELLSYYGFDMNDPSALAVVYQNFVATDGGRERNTTQEVIDLINMDLNEAASAITSTDVNFPTQDFITFTRARLALYTGDYNGAITQANSIIANYPLATAGQYAAMFGGDADATEVIWKYDNVQGSNNSVAGNFIFTGTGGDFIEASSELRNAFSAGDIRRDVVTISSVSPQNTGDAWTINKYPANADENYINDFKIMRVSEMYLVRAEANARKSSPDFGAAATDIMAIRTARGSSTATPAAYTSLAQAIQDISDERRLELCFEGHRYLDIKRYRGILNVGITRDAADVSYLGNNFPSLVTSPTDFRFTFPIPNGETNGNPNITQAPGY